jgi:hypothetical protein
LWIIYNNVIQSLQDYKGTEWTRKYKIFIADDFHIDELILLLERGDDSILENVVLWKIINQEIDSLFLHKIIKTILKQNPLSFPNIMAILAKKDLQESDLWEILNVIFDIPWYEYLMRLVHRHSNSTIPIKERLSKSQLIDAKYKTPLLP